MTSSATSRLDFHHIKVDFKKNQKLFNPYRALHKLPFKMLTQKRIFECVRTLDWFAAIDLKDAHFHVLILLRQGIPAIRVRGWCMSVQALAFQAPQPVGFSGQLGKEQTCASALICIQINAEDLFSRHGVDSVSQTARLTQERAQSVLNRLKTLSGRTTSH